MIRPAWLALPIAPAMVAVLAAAGCESPTAADLQPEGSAQASSQTSAKAVEPVEQPQPVADSPSVEAPPTRGIASPQTAATEDRLLDKNFDDIKFDIEPDTPFSRELLEPEIEDMAGRRVRIRGYILPTAQKRGIKQFVLVRDNQECCFGDGAALYDCILVEMAKGKSAEFSIRPVAVEGRFAIEEFKDFEGKTRAIYRMQGHAVE